MPRGWGNRLAHGEASVNRPLALLIGAAMSVSPISACRNLEVVTNSYATMAEARQSGAVERGWLPEMLPTGAHDIREAHDDAVKRRRWGLFSFRPEDADFLRGRLGSEISLAGVACDAPARIEWWPVLLRGTLDPDSLAATGLKGYSATGDRVVVAVNWNQRRAYYWSVA